MRIAIGSDHRGFNLKQSVARLLTELGHDYQDMGSYNNDSVDYPDIAAKVAGAVASGEADVGILACGTGIGMSITANKVQGVRAAVCHDALTARMAKEHNNANVLCIGGDILDEARARDIVRTYLATSFQGGRHARRVGKIGELEQRQANSSRHASLQSARG